MTALQAAAALPDGSALPDRGLQRHVSFEEVYQAYCRAIGRRDSAAPGPVDRGGGPRRSAVERVPVRLLRAAGIGRRVSAGPDRSGPHVVAQIAAALAAGA
jgi:hypothetical protein